MEIITGVERRRRWQTEDKLRIVAEARQSSTVAIARRYEISRGLLYHWRRQLREGHARPRFAPLQIVDSTAPPTPAPQEASIRASPFRAARRKGMMEIDLGSERRIRVARDVDGEALRRVIEALTPR